jgi:hypothetical protein
MAAPSVRTISRSGGAANALALKHPTSETQTAMRMEILLMVYDAHLYSAD